MNLTGNSDKIWKCVRMIMKNKKSGKEPLLPLREDLSLLIHFCIVKVLTQMSTKIKF